ncbi:hypothetical protein [Clostridium sp. E02]|uniref:hypothetical protein n=1 Tax=Clostridium sp. E02 TaxID=2487134 RepID=UPI000F53DF15|nr:hypothetical protein [Clostridium sp. E02]
MRKSSKEQREEKVKREKALQAEMAVAIKAPPVMSFSARMPAYTYTSLCSDPKLKKSPEHRSNHPEGIQPVVTEKLCLICRKHWPVDCGRENCDCDRQGHLFSSGVYYEPKRKEVTVWRLR